MPTIEAVRIDGERLRELRRSRFLTRDELAEKSGVARDHIGRLERGEIEGESRMRTIRSLAEALGVDPRELVR
jgi:transcriptional regulator with XRE-family HTH domain